MLAHVFRWAILNRPWLLGLGRNDYEGEIGIVDRRIGAIAPVWREFVRKRAFHDSAAPLAGGERYLAREAHDHAARLFEQTFFAPPKKLAEKTLNRRFGS